MVNEKGKTLSEYYGLSDERIEELFTLTDPMNFKGGIEYVINLRKVVKDDNELDFMIAHVVSCLVHVVGDLQTIKIKNQIVENISNMDSN